MSRSAQMDVTRGSQSWLQRLVNDRPELLTKRLPGADGSVEWLSPLRTDEYAEYSDEEFVRLLGLKLDRRPLAAFWPRGGPVWDGLGRSADGAALLVEAKAHIPELLSAGCGASADASRALIGASLSEARRFYGAPESADWTGRFYQYANRLAHVYLLRELNGIPAKLVLVYFVGDREMHGPTTSEEWLGALRLLHASLGVQERRLTPHVAEVFVDVREIGDVT